MDKEFHYHTSFFNNIKVFHPFSHFGLEPDALMNVGRKRIDEGVFDQPYIYQVKIEYEPHELVEVDKDWGTPKPIGIASVLRYALGREWYEPMEKIRSDLCDKKNQVGGKEWVNQYGYQPIFDFLANEGVVAIKYPNIVEANGEPSLCLVVPARAKILNSRPLTTAEIDQAVADYISSQK